MAQRGNGGGWQRRRRKQQRQHQRSAYRSNGMAHISNSAPWQR